MWFRVAGDTAKWCWINYNKQGVNRGSSFLLFSKKKWLSGCVNKTAKNSVAISQCGASTQAAIHACSSQMKLFLEVMFLSMECVRALHSSGGINPGLCEPLAEWGGCQVVRVLRGGLQERQHLPSRKHHGWPHQAPDPDSPGEGIICAVTRKIQQSKLLDVVHHFFGGCCHCPACFGMMQCMVWKCSCSRCSQQYRTVG